MRLCRTALALLLLTGCAQRRPAELPDFAASASGEETRVVDLYPGVTATIVAPKKIDVAQRVELILYALPNGNSTAETIGRRQRADAAWRYDIQHIGAQTRALRARGLSQAVVVYLEAAGKSWPAWRSSHGYERANARIVSIVDQLRYAIGNPARLAVTLTGHSGGGSFAWGFIDGQAELPDWLERIAFLDSNYGFEYRHGEKIVRWLRRNPQNTLVVLAYNDRDITVDGRRVVSDSGGTWRATQRMLNYLREPYAFTMDTAGEFLRHRAPQIEMLLHPNPANRILHTELVGEMNGYMHALLVRRPSYRESVLKRARAYTAFIEDDVVLPAAAPPSIPARAADAPGGSAFIASLSALSREEREAAVLRELMTGNIPSFLRSFRSVEVTARDAAGVEHHVAYEVMPDYLAIGSDEDFVRMPMVPYTAQAFCDAFGLVLPTRKLVNDAWTAAAVKLEPRPLTEQRESPQTFLQHHRIIEQQLAGVERGAFVAGIKKDVVVSNKLDERPNRVAIYGWHYQNGQPIQPLYSGHVDWYVDYSHGIRPVRRSITIDGVAHRYEDVLADSTRAPLLSDEGPIARPRYERVRD